MEVKWKIANTTTDSSKFLGLIAGLFTDQPDSLAADMRGVKDYGISSFKGCQLKAGESLYLVGGRDSLGVAMQRLGAVTVSSPGMLSWDINQSKHLKTAAKGALKVTSQLHRNRKQQFGAFKEAKSLNPDSVAGDTMEAASQRALMRGQIQQSGTLMKTFKNMREVNAPLRKAGRQNVSTALAKSYTILQLAAGVGDAPVLAHSIGHNSVTMAAFRDFVKQSVGSHQRKKWG